MIAPSFPETATNIVGFAFLTFLARVTNPVTCGAKIASLAVKRRVMWSPDLANELERELLEKEN